MRIIISPAKTMKEKESGFDYIKSPVLVEKTQKILEELKKYDISRLSKLMKCNLQLATLNYNRFQSMDLFQGGYPALWCYEGLQYKYMAAHVFSEDEVNYVCKNLRILSGFYGILRPQDRVHFYRLEMQTPLEVGGSIDLIDYWKDDIYQELYRNEDVVINLASQEYSQVIEPYIKDYQKFIHVVFAQRIDGKLKVKGTLAKMARGAMVRYMAEYQVNNLEQLMQFKELSFHYSEENSSPTRLTFIQE